MADRTAIRLAVDLAFAAATIACGVTVYAMTRTPEVPPGLCASDTGPRYDAMLSDGRITIAAVFGEIKGGPADHNVWSYRVAGSGLRERGFVEVEPDRYQLGAVTVDLALIPNDRAQTTAALAGAIASHDVIYYNGHSHGGRIDIAPPADYRLIAIDSCWSTQHFAMRLVGPNRDVLTNEERSVTGSVETLFILVDALQARDPAWPLAEMNERALARSTVRAPISRYKQPERYRVDAACR